MSDRETRMMARMRREDEARRARRDQITTYGLVAVIVTFGGARYAGHRSLERACLALLGAFGLYAVGVRCGVFYPRISRRRRGCGGASKETGFVPHAGRARGHERLLRVHHAAARAR